MGMRDARQSAFAKVISTRLRRDSLRSLDDWMARQAVARDASEGWWAHKGSNLGPLPCDRRAQIQERTYFMAFRDIFKAVVHILHTSNVEKISPMAPASRVC